MAQNSETNIIINVKEKGKEAITGLKSSLAGLVGTAAAVAAGVIAVGAAIGKLAKDAAEVQEVEDAFKNLAAAQGQSSDDILAKLKEASGGILAQVDLLKLANSAMLAGIPVDKLDQVVKIARAAADATGDSVENMVGTITNGLARGSTMMLRHAGIVFDAEAAYKTYAESLGKTAEQLSDAEKKQVFLTAAMAEGEKTLSKLGEGQLSAADKWDKVKATISDYTVALGKMFIPALEHFLDLTVSAFNALDNFASSEGVLAFFQTLEVVLAEAEMGFYTLIGLVGDLGDAFSAFSQAASLALTGNFQDAADTIEQSWKGVQEKMAGYAAAREEKIATIEEKYVTASAKREAEKAKADADLAKTRETIKQEELLKIRTDAAKTEEQIDRENFEQHLEAKKNLEKAALDNRIRVRQETDKAEAAAMQQMAKEHAATVSAISSGVQSFVTKGLQGMTSQAVGFIADTLLPGIGGAASAIFDLLSMNTEQFKETILKLFSTDFINNIAQNLVTLIEMLPDILINIINFLAENMPAIIEKLIDAIIGNLPEITSALLKAFIKMAADPEFIAGLAAAIAKGFISGIREAAGEMAAELKKIIPKIDIGGGGGGGGFKIGGKKLFYHGGLIPAYANGGLIDNMLARVTPGEYVINRDSTMANKGLLDQINGSNGRAVGGGNNISITVNGGLLGDYESARQFARAVDTELYKLRQGNEARSFDRSLT